MNLEPVSLKNNPVDPLAPSLLPFSGNGFFAGELREEGILAAGIVRVVVSETGQTLYTITVGEDGLWRADNLDPNIKFDIYARLNNAAWESKIFGERFPTEYPAVEPFNLELDEDTFSYFNQATLSEQLVLIGGTAPYIYEQISPIELIPDVNVTVSETGLLEAGFTYDYDIVRTFSFKATDAELREKIISLNLTIERDPSLPWYKGLNWDDPLSTFVTKIDDYYGFGPTSGSVGARPVYSDAYKSTSGKYSIRFRLDTDPNTILTGSQKPAFVAFGFKKEGVSMGSYIGQNSNSWGLWLHSGNANIINAYHSATPLVLENPSTFDPSIKTVEGMIDVDLATGQIWFGIDDVYFNSGDPEAGTGHCYNNLNGSVSPCLDFYGITMGSAKLLRPHEFTTAVPAGFTPGWPE